MITPIFINFQPISNLCNLFLICFVGEPHCGLPGGRPQWAAPTIHLNIVICQIANFLSICARSQVGI